MGDVKALPLRSMAVLHKDRDMNVHGNIIHKSQKLEGIQIAINWKMYFFLMWYIHTVKYCSVRKRKNKTKKLLIQDTT